MRFNNNVAFMLALSNIMALGDADVNEQRRLRGKRGVRLLQDECFENDDWYACISSPGCRWAITSQFWLDNGTGEYSNEGRCIGSGVMGDCNDRIIEDSRSRCYDQGINDEYECEVEYVRDCLNPGEPCHMSCRTTRPGPGDTYKCLFIDDPDPQSLLDLDLYSNTTKRVRVYCAMNEEVHCFRDYYEYLLPEHWNPLPCKKKEVMCWDFNHYNETFDNESCEKEKDLIKPATYDPVDPVDTFRVCYGQSGVVCRLILV